MERIEVHTLAADGEEIAPAVVDNVFFINAHTHGNADSLLRDDEGGEILFINPDKIISVAIRDINDDS